MIRLSMLENYRHSENAKEILSILKRSSGSEQSYMWVNLDGKRYKYEVINLEVNDEFFLMTMELESEKKRYFKAGNTYFLKLNYDHTVFKVHVISVVNNIITCQIPQQVFTIEKRHAPRVLIDASDYITVSIAIGSEIMPGSLQEFNFRIRDYSKGGFCLVLYKKDHLELLTDSSSMYLTKINESLIRSKIMAKIAFVKRIKFKENGRIKSGFKVGIELNKPLQENEMQLFI
ncbi:MAG: hypothetical protein N4A33_12395 [Bacteriovoracaceae bacterium]|jgi:hypothetical protein|nr:hypothetical protein [Bacteriovoracaceae bacterium]